MHRGTSRRENKPPKVLQEPRREVRAVLQRHGQGDARLGPHSRQPSGAGHAVPDPFLGQRGSGSDQGNRLPPCRRRGMGVRRLQVALHCCVVRRRGRSRRTPCQDPVGHSCHVRGDSLPLVQYALGREVGRKSRMRDFEGAPARRDTGVWAGLILGIDRLTLCRGWCLLRLTDIFVFAVFCFFRPLFSDAVARRIGSSEGCNRERG